MRAGAQDRALAEIFDDMRRPVAMHRCARDACGLEIVLRLATGGNAQVRS
jgi:hypothetical protein